MVINQGSSSVGMNFSWERKKMVEKAKITLISTGGTIEKQYDEVKGVLINRESLVKTNILERLRLPYTEILFKTILSKDSLDFTSADRQILFESVLASLRENHRVVILHGTDSMALSAQYLKEGLGAVSMPVILTGAMRPMGFIDSDAFQNVVEALTLVKVLPPEVYLSFHNQVFTLPGVRKNVCTGTFEGPCFANHVQ
jgi:L-asparaginase